jgi:hypothetical protein
MILFEQPKIYYRTYHKIIIKKISFILTKHPNIIIEKKKENKNKSNLKTNKK